VETGRRRDKVRGFLAVVALKVGEERPARGRGVCYSRKNALGMHGGFFGSDFFKETRALEERAIVSNGFLLLKKTTRKKKGGGVDLRSSREKSQGPAGPELKREEKLSDGRRSDSSIAQKGKRGSGTT